MPENQSISQQSEQSLYSRVCLLEYYVFATRQRLSSRSRNLSDLKKLLGFVQSVDDRLANIHSEIAAIRSSLPHFEDSLTDVVDSDEI
jgi:hypothetical protein